MRRLLRYTRPYLAILALSLLFALAYEAARSARPYLLKPLFDNVLLVDEQSDDLSWPGLAALREALPALSSSPDAKDAAGLRESIWLLLLAGALIGLVLPVAHFGKVYAVEYAMGRVLIDLQRDQCRKLLTLPLSFHRNLRRGDTLTRTLNDVTRAHQGLRILIGDVLQSAVSVVVGTTFLFYLSVKLTLVALVVVPPIAYLVGSFGRRIRRTARRRQQTLGDLTQRLLEILTGIKEIKAYRAEAHEESAFGRENERLFRRGLRVARYRISSRSSVEAIAHYTFLGVIALGVWLAVRGRWGITPGILAAFGPALIHTQRQARELVKSYTHLQDASPSVARFFELLDESEPDYERSGAPALPGIEQGIRFSGVSFSYGREQVLEDLDFEIAAGQVVALVGRTGAGKTTIADLLLGFHTPDRGHIEVDGVSLDHYDRHSIFDHAAIVTQEPFLFDGTIRDNILYGRPEADNTRFENAARAAYVDEFVQRLPEGYETRVGEAGGQLSGGQRQRITIARALLKDPALLIFDEATSALDAQSEQWVQRAIRELFLERSVLLIAHRLSTIRHADLILVLENGRIAERGDHDTLLREGGLYRDLVSLQAPPAETSS